MPDGLLPQGVGVQGQEELPVGEALGQPVGGVHRQRGLADSGHSVDRVDAEHDARRNLRSQRLEQPRHFSLAASEAGTSPRQGPGGSGCGSARFESSRDGNRRSRPAAAGCRHKQRTYRLS
jgi:hypothetical protein